MADEDRKEEKPAFAFREAGTPHGVRKVYNPGPAPAFTLPRPAVDFLDREPLPPKP